MRTLFSYRVRLLHKSGRVPARTSHTRGGLGRARPRPPSRPAKLRSPPRSPGPRRPPRPPCPRSGCVCSRVAAARRWPRWPVRPSRPAPSRRHCSRMYRDTQCADPSNRPAPRTAVVVGLRVAGGGGGGAHRRGRRWRGSPRAPRRRPSTLPPALSDPAYVNVYVRYLTSILTRTWSSKCSKF